MTGTDRAWAVTASSIAVMLVAALLYATHPDDELTPLGTVVVLVVLVCSIGATWLAWTDRTPDPEEGTP